MSVHHPELLPAAMRSGFTLPDAYRSVKPGLRARRSKLRATGEVFLVRPSWVLPYLAAKTDTVEKALYLRQWGGALCCPGGCLWSGRAVLLSGVAQAGAVHHSGEHGQEGSGLAPAFAGGGKAYVVAWPAALWGHDRRRRLFSRSCGSGRGFAGGGARWVG